MKLKSDFLLREIAGTYIVVPVGERVIDFKGMIRLNDSGKFLWDCLGEDISSDELLHRFMDEYEVDEETAKTDLIAFLHQSREAGLLVE